MKTIIVSLLAVVAIQSSAFAAIICSNEIKNKALESASYDGHGDCRVGELNLDQIMIADDSETGTISLVCERHVSQLSVATETVLYQFSVPSYADMKALDCSAVSLSDSAQ